MALAPFELQKFQQNCGTRYLSPSLCAAFPLCHIIDEAIKD